MDIDVLIIIVAVAASIFTSINKRKKEATKRQNASQQPPAGEQAEDNDPWAAFKEVFREFSGEETAEEDIITRAEPPYAEAEDIFGRKVFSYEEEAVERMNNNTEIAEKGTAMRDGLYSEFSKQNAIASARNNRAKQVIAPVPGHDGNHQTGENSEEYKQWDSDILDRFNLRDAVIYSEILKPKFKE